MNNFNNYMIEFISFIDPKETWFENYNPINFINSGGSFPSSIAVILKSTP